MLERHCLPSVILTLCKISLFVLRVISGMALNINNLLKREYVVSCFETHGCINGAERQAIFTAIFRF